MLPFPRRWSGRAARAAVQPARSPCRPVSPSLRRPRRERATAGHTMRQPTLWRDEGSFESPFFWLERIAQFDADFARSRDVLAAAERGLPGIHDAALVGEIVAEHVEPERSALERQAGVDS